MGVKFEEKNRARELRRQGYSYNEIPEHVSVSKGALSLWLRDITLTEEQIARFANKRCGGREKFIQVMRERRDNRWADYRRQAEQDWDILSQDPGFMFGLALYVGEGSKTKNEQLCITNCDPRVIHKAIEFFSKIGVPREALRVGIQIPPGLSKEAAEVYWRNVTGLCQEQFHRTRDAVTRTSSGTKGNTQVYGTCRISSYSTRLKQKLHRWMELALNAPLV